MTPDEEPAGPPVAEAEQAAEQAEEALSRRVAVLIMAVTLVGSVFAFLQTAATNRAALAVRRSETAAVESTGELARGEGHIAMEQQVWMLAGEEGALGLLLAGASGGEGGETIGALAEAFTAQRGAMLSHSDLQAAYQRSDGSVEWGRFTEEMLAPTYRSAEYQKAYAAERDGWGAKGGAYVAVVTVLAVALFLIGLSRTVRPGSGGPLVVAGAALAGIAALWGFVVFLRPVAAPSPTAIDAYVEGRVAFSAVLWETDPGRVRPMLGEAEEAFTRAIEQRADYIEAYGGRGMTLFRLDLLRPGGPIGSEQAAADFGRTVADDPLDPVAWGNLGAARFWLGDLAGAGEATRRALAVNPDDPTFNLNLGLFLAVVGDDAGYRAQLARLEEVLAADEVPTWLRSYVFAGSAQVLDLAERYRPDYADAVRLYRDDLLRIEHQISVGRLFFGAAIPEAVEAAISPLSFVLSADRTALQATFDATGVVAGQRWLWRAYVGGIEDPALSAGPEAWPFAVPADQVTITLTLPGGFAVGVPVRIEVFIEGNLLRAGEYTP